MQRHRHNPPTARRPQIHVAAATELLPRGLASILDRGRRKIADATGHRLAHVALVDGEDVGDLTLTLWAGSHGRPPGLGVIRASRGESIGIAASPGGEREARRRAQRLRAAR
jgi:hypothetical protein